MQTQPVIVERPAQPYLAIKERVLIPFGATVDRVLPELDAWFAARRLAPSGPPFFKYDRVAMPELDVAFGMPVDAAVDGDARVAAGVLPPGRFAQLTHRGHYDGLMEATGRLLDWAKAEGLAWDMQAAADGDHFACRLEIYRTDPTIEHDPAAWITDIAIKLAD